MGFIIVALGIAMLIGGVVMPVDALARIALGVGGLVVVSIGVSVTLMSFYRRTSADMAFVRTGQGGSKSCWTAASAWFRSCTGCWRSICAR